MYKIYFSFIAVLMLMISACSTSCKAKREQKKAEKEVTAAAQTDSIQNNVATTHVGDWSLITYVCCGRTTKTQHFDAKDEKKFLHLGADGSYYIANKMEATGKQAGNYTVSDKNEFGPSINLGTNYAAMLSMKGNDTLILSWGYMDLQTEIYLRKK